MAKKKQKEEVKEVEFETPTQNDLGVISIQQKNMKIVNGVFNLMKINHKYLLGQMTN